MSNEMECMCIACGISCYIPADLIKMDPSVDDSNLIDSLPFLEDLYTTTFEKLIEFNLKIIRYLMKQLKIDTNITLLSELGVFGTGDNRIVAVCRRLGDSRFLVQKTARKYYDAQHLASAGIQVVDFKPISPVYPQLWGNFIPNLSALDLVLNCGPKAHDIITQVLPPNMVKKP